MLPFRRITTRVVVLLTLSLSACMATKQTSGNRTVKTPETVTIVSSGQHAPDTVYLSRNAAVLERVPLDGVCTWIATPTPILLESGDTYVTRLQSGRLRRIATGEDAADVGQTVVHRQRIPLANIKPAIEDLRSADFKRFDSNFIHTITGNANGPMDWYDDEWWQTICHNGRMIAKVAKEGRFRGILIDPEVYSYSWWGFAMLTETAGKQPYRRGNKTFYEGKSVEDVMVKVRQRGREFAAAINEEFPDPVLMFFHAAGYAAWQVSDPRWDNYKEAPFGLIGPFIDGMLEGSTDGTTIVDCTSQAKWWRTRSEFEAGRKLVKEDALALSQVPRLYAKKVKLGFCFRLGANPREEQIGEAQGVPPPFESWMYDPEHPEKNYYSPARLEEALKLALEIGDGYVLFWNYRANWWLDGPDGKPADGAPISDRARWVPRAYWQAIENARAAATRTDQRTVSDSE